MKIIQTQNVVTISEILEIHYFNAQEFQSLALQALEMKPEFIEIDFSETHFIDRSGLGSLFWLYRLSCTRYDGVRLLIKNPSAVTFRLLDLAQIRQLFLIRSNDGRLL